MKNTVNDLPQRAKINASMCKSTGALSDLFPRVILSDVIAGVVIPDNKKTNQLRMPELTSDKFWIFYSAIIKNSVLPL